MGAACHSVRLIDQEIGRELDPLFFTTPSQGPRVGVLAQRRALHRPWVSFLRRLHSLLDCPLSFFLLRSRHPLPRLLTNDPPFTYQRMWFYAFLPLRPHLFFFFPTPTGRFSFTVFIFFIFLPLPNTFKYISMCRIFKYIPIHRLPGHIWHNRYVFAVPLIT